MVGKMELDLDRLRRESGLRLDVLGRWHFRGHLVENDRVQRLFHRGLRWHPEERAATLHVGEQWAWVQYVDDVPYFVERLEGDDVVLLSDERVPIADAGLAVTDAGVVYAMLADGRRARFLRRAMQDLEPHLDEADGRVVVRTARGALLVGALPEVTSPGILAP